MLVSILGITGVLAARLQARAGSLRTDQREASSYARSAVDLARWMTQDSNWRTTRAPGMWVSRQPLGQGSFSLEVFNPNGPSFNGTDPVVVWGTGFRGQARARVQVTLDPKIAAYTALQVCETAAGGLNLTISNITNNQTLSTNGAVTATAATVTGDVEAGTTISGVYGTGLRKKLGKPRTLPDPTTAFDFYIQNGTDIPISSIPLSGLNRQLQLRLLSPTSNPFGAPNANGIYVIDCMGQNLQIANCRVLGTLIVLNPGTNSALQNSDYFSPAVANYPVLMVKGDWTIKINTTPLADNANTNTTPPSVNYNPSGSPYAGASPTTDSTYTTTYPSRLDGLVYVSGSLTTNSTLTLQGILVVGGTHTIQGAMNLTYDATSYTNPPPGFYPPPKMSVRNGSWRPG